MLYDPFIKKTFLIILIILFPIWLFALKIGLDSGHSIKELYKGGGAFQVTVDIDDDGNPIKSPYYSVAWPAGGVRLLSKTDNAESKASSIYDAVGTYVKMTTITKA